MPDDTEEQQRGVTLERAAFRAESPLRRIVGSHRLNPLPHAGTITIFLLVVVVISGVYITLFFGFGFEASYRSVEKMHDHPIQNVVRSVHRYASAALVLTTLVHAWRIFVAGRFSGPRGKRWITGLASLVTVWLAGVTGYWLVWDQRAQALTEAAFRLVRSTGTGAELMVREIVGSSAGTGWGLLFTIWVVHLLLTVVIGWFVWRHVRRTRMRSLPPRYWMLAMTGALIVVSIALPTGLLDRLDHARFVPDMPLDPFVMFLLPLLGEHGWLVLAATALVVVAVGTIPRLAGRTPTVVEVDAERCTGCELCVPDCPWLALEMVSRATADQPEGTRRERPIAVVDTTACVGCGICLGSCSFGALRIPGLPEPSPVDPAGKAVVIACRRHLETADRPTGVEIVEVSCTGMLHPQTVGALERAGATSVHIVGCAPGECAFGIGNEILAGRLSGERQPHLPARWAGYASVDWVSPGELTDAVAHPGVHPSVSVDDRPPDRRRLAAAAAVVLVSVAGVAVATSAPFRTDDERVGVRVVVDHVPGSQIEGYPTDERPGGDVVVTVRADGAELRSDVLPRAGSAAVGIVDATLPDETRRVEVLLRDGDREITLYDADPTLGPGDRLIVEAVDVPPEPGVGQGRAVFADNARGGCGICHSTDGGAGVGPSLQGVAVRAAERVPGLSAEEYLRQSVLDPQAYTVPGYQADQMPPIYLERLSPEDVEALLTYLESLKEEA